MLLFCTAAAALQTKWNVIWHPSDYDDQLTTCSDHYIIIDRY